MAADAAEQTTAAKTESASQSMYRGAGQERVNLYAGDIVQIGRRSDGSRRVVFRSTSSTFDTQWPKWAYQIAMAAYLYDKQIQVVADGQPDGDKLLSVNLILPLHSPHQGPQPYAPPLRRGAPLEAAGAVRSMCHALRIHPLGTC